MDTPREKITQSSLLHAIVDELRQMNAALVDVRKGTIEISQEVSAIRKHIGAPFEE